MKLSNLKRFQNDSCDLKFKKDFLTSLCGKKSDGGFYAREVFLTDAAFLGLNDKLISSLMKCHEIISLH